jgi:phosphate-selective porin
VERVTGGRTTAVRVRVEPFAASRTASGDLQVGVALVGSRVPEGYAALRGRTHLDASFFSPDYWVNGARRRLGAELRWRPGPFSVEAEYMRVDTERLGQSVDDGDLSPLVATGWYVSGTWALTGERKSRGLDEPRRPLFRGGFGALELALRTESLAFRSGTGDEPPSSSPRAEVIRGNQDRADTAGLNWYLNRWIKVQGNVVRERLSDPALGPLPARAAFWSRVLRLQLTL